MYQQSITPPNHMLSLFLPHSAPQSQAICCGCAQKRGCVCRLRCTSSTSTSAARVPLMLHTETLSGLNESCRRCNKQAERKAVCVHLCVAPERTFKGDWTEYIRGRVSDFSCGEKMKLGVPPERRSSTSFQYVTKCRKELTDGAEVC